MERHVRETPGSVTPQIYLDYQATTPVAPEVAAAMRPWIETHFANPHSPSAMGREAAAAIELARERIVEALGASDLPGKLYFTSGATEALNWALKGAIVCLPADRQRVVTLPTEHAAVLDTVAWLEATGHDAGMPMVGFDGLVVREKLEQQVTDSTGIVAAMLVNNEIGVIQPVAEIAEIAHRRGALFLCDAVQGFGRVPLPVESCDMVALSAHKVHGPKGVGALWVRDGTRLSSLLHGGGQEGRLRSGTLSPALCVGFGEAARLLQERREADHLHVETLWRLALDRLPGWTLNGSAEARYKGNLSLHRDSVDAARLISEVRRVAFSAGSACASGSGRSSHVLELLLPLRRLQSATIRLGFGRYTTEAEIVEATALIQAAADRQLDQAA